MTPIKCPNCGQHDDYDSVYVGERLIKICGMCGSWCE